MNSRLIPYAAAIAIVVASLLAFASHRPQRPTSFVNSAPRASHASKVDGSWYWIEQRDPIHAVLVRCDDSGVARDITTAERITDYSVGSDRAIVLSQTAKLCHVVVASLTGGTPREVWTGDTQPHGAFIAGENAYWMRSRPATNPSAVVFPPLAPQTEVVCTPLAGGETRVVSVIMEESGDSVIGVRSGDLYVSAVRTDQQSSTAFYRIPLRGGVPDRIIAESGRQSALLTPGAIYWTAPSREAQNSNKIVCVNRLTAQGQPMTLGDWLPAGGRLYSTQRGINYVDGSYLPSAWTLSTLADLPAQVPIAGRFTVLAAGDGDLLLRPRMGGASLYRAWPK